VSCGGRLRAPPLGRQGGSALLLVVFACIAVAVVIQAISTVILCAEGAVIDEYVGRKRLAEKDEGLAALRQQALTLWEPRGWGDVGQADGLGHETGEGALWGIPDSGGWTLNAAIRQAPAVSRLTASACLERGRDGVDLPLAAAVAEMLTATPGRSVPWVEGAGAPLAGGDGVGSGLESAIYVVHALGQPLLGPGCTEVALAAPWRLDGGWADLGSGGREAGEAELSPGAGVVWVEGRFGRSETLPEGIGGQNPDEPILVLVTGGATLDARDKGDVYGVLVVDDGSLLLDGTIVHGAVLVTGRIDLGDSGRLIYTPSILRWATDRSLNRVRLVPGTRAEGME